MRTCILALSLSAAPLLVGCGSGDTVRAGRTLRFTAIPDDNATELLERFDPLAEYLGETLGIPVEYVASSDYTASVEMFKTGDVQLAWFGGLTGAQARAAVPGARAIAQGKIDPEFRSYFLAHADTGLERGEEFPAGLRGRSFCFGSEDSTSGRLMPEHFIREHTGLAPEEFFGRPNAFSGSHDRTIELVQSGAYDAGAVNFRTYERWLAEGRVDPERCRVVWVTPEYADYNWTVHPALDETFGSGTVDRLQAALVGLADAELLRAVDRADGLISATNEDFESIRDLALELGFL